MTICSRCETKKESVTKSGSFLCDECQEKQFDRVRKIVKERKNKMSINLVKKHMDVGLKAKEIAEKTGLTVSTVYTYMSKIRQDTEGKEEPKRNANGESTVNLGEYLEKYKKLKSDYKKLKIENSKVTDEEKELEDEYDKLARDYQELSRQVANGVSTNNSEIEALQKIISELQDENRTLRKRNDELIDEANEEMNKLRIELEVEKRKHKSLLDYVTAKSVS